MLEKLLTTNRRSIQGQRETPLAVFLQCLKRSTSLRRPGLLRPTFLSTSMSAVASKVTTQLAADRDSSLRGTDKTCLAGRLHETFFIHIDAGSSLNKAGHTLQLWMGRDYGFFRSRRDPMFKTMFRTWTWIPLVFHGRSLPARNGTDVAPMTSCLELWSVCTKSIGE